MVREADRGCDRGDDRGELLRLGYCQVLQVSDRDRDVAWKVEPPGSWPDPPAPKLGGLMQINALPELRSELKSIEECAELQPSAQYVFKFNGIISNEARDKITDILTILGIRAIVVDSKLAAIYKIERQ